MCRMSQLEIVCSVSCVFYVVFGRVVLLEEAFLPAYSVAFRPWNWGLFGRVALRGAGGLFRNKHHDTDCYTIDFCRRLIFAAIVCG